jgi:hypothetical protein
VFFLSGLDAKTENLSRIKAKSVLLLLRETNVEKSFHIWHNMKEKNVIVDDDSAYFTTQLPNMKFDDSAHSLGSI